jgi:hypothetical protein
VQAAQNLPVQGVQKTQVLLKLLVRMVQEGQNLLVREGQS